MTHTPQIFITSKINCDFHNFVNQAYTPVFDKFIYACAGGDEKKAILLMEIIGYYITSDVNGKCFVVLWGPWDTGKSVIGQFLSRLFNHEAVSAIDLNDLGSRFDNYTLVGCKLNIAMDLPNGKINSNAVSKLKMLTGNDLCKAEAKYMNPFMFKNTCKFLFASNFRVATATFDVGFNNRLVEVYMGNVIPKEKQDKNLINKLMSEAPDIIHKCLRYYLEYKNRNYIFTKVAENVNMPIYKSIEQIVEEFVQCQFDYKPNESELSIDVYECFNRFCETNNYNCTISQPKLTIELKKLTYPDFVKFCQLRKGERTCKGIKGVKLLDLY
ncbi:MAG: phage/plasmid primase, P4 family [Clostridia bacterium]|nr:phage/plasmid primase, P4 family [Clostridia bacterium]